MWTINNVVVVVVVVVVVIELTGGHASNLRPLTDRRAKRKRISTEIRIT
jgi:hypothetical protein